MTVEPIRTIKCCFTLCKEGSSSLTSKVEIKAAKQNVTGCEDKFVVLWSKSNEAVFHPKCWTILQQQSRKRKRRGADVLVPSLLERQLLRDADKSAEYFDADSEIMKSADRCAELLRKSRYVVAFTGAGISTAAGIGDYRGKSGKWTEEDRGTDVQDDEDDDGVQYESLRPTYTHEALVELLRLGQLQHIISQNGDGLHGLSGVPDDKLSELHGNVFQERCENSKCNRRYARDSYVLDDAASQYFEDISETGHSELKRPKHAVGCSACGLCHRTGRLCEQCGGHLCDTIINFGDQLEKEILTRAETEAERCDTILVLGSTVSVTPACELVQPTKNRVVIIVNRQKTALDDEAVERSFGDCDPWMRRLMSGLVSQNHLTQWEAGRESRTQVYDIKRTQTDT